MKPSDYDAMKNAFKQGEVTVGEGGKAELKLTAEQKEALKRRRKNMREHDEGLVRSGQACPNCGSENCEMHKALKDLPPGTPVVLVPVPVPMPRPGKAARHKCLECGRPEEEHSEVMCPTPRWGIEGQDEV